MTVICCLLLAVACNRPPSMEYISRDDGTGTYSFTIDMADSTYVYDLSFFTEPEGRHPGGFPMKINMVSPSGLTYFETVYFTYGESCVVPYRCGLVPKEFGIWKVEVRARAEGLKWLGLIINNRKWDTIN